MNTGVEFKTFTVYTDGETAFEVGGALDYYLDEDGSLNFYNDTDEVFSTFAPYSWLCVGIDESEEQA